MSNPESAPHASIRITQHDTHEGPTDYIIEPQIEDSVVFELCTQGLHKRNKDPQPTVFDDEAFRIANRDIGQTVCQLRGLALSEEVIKRGRDLETALTEMGYETELNPSPFILSQAP